MPQINFTDDEVEMLTGIIMDFLDTDASLNYDDRKVGQLLGKLMME